MSQTIDERVVKMEFDNSEFDKNINASQKSLDAFNDYLNKSAKESGGYFEDLDSSANKISFDSLINSVQNISEHFSVFGVVAKRVLEDLTDAAYNAGLQFAKSLTVEDIAAGWSKYEQKTQGVMTIMAATGKSVDDVNGSLEKLNWYTDETSYNFTDMVSNIGKFTAAGVDLDDAVSAMMGIGNVASVSGQGISEASRAMYNFAQAMGVGVVKLMDWKSIENANMATMEFKDTIIETALEMGTIEKTANGMYKAIGEAEDHAFDAASFSSSLSDNWFTGDVLVATLKKYSAYSDGLYEIADAYGTCSEAMEHFNGEGMELGEKAFRAAQEAKTFGEAVASVHDAISTGWMTTFEYLFGNYQEAKMMWTDLANLLWELFAAPGVERNEFLEDVMTSSWDKIRKGITDTGLEADIFDDKIASIANDLLKDRWYENIAQPMLNGLDDQFTSMEELRENIEFTGKTWEDYLKETGSLQDAMLASGLDFQTILSDSMEDLISDVLETKYVSEDAEQQFKKFSDTIKTTYKETGDIQKVREKLLEQGYQYSASEYTINKIIDDQVETWKDLRYWEQEEIVCRDYANKAWDKFTGTIKDANKEGKNTTEIYDMLIAQGYDLSDNRGIITKVLNNEIDSWNRLSYEERNAIIWMDETLDFLGDQYEGIYDVNNEYNKYFESLYRKDARDTFVGSLTKILEGLVSGVKLWRDVWDETVPHIQAETILDIVEAFDRWVDSMALSEEGMDKLANTFKGIDTIFVIFGKVIRALLIPITTVIEKISGVNVSILDMTSSMADGIIAFNDWLDETDILNTSMQKVADVLGGIIDKFVEFYNTLREKFLSGESPIQALQNTFHEMSDSLAKDSETVEQSAFGKIGTLIFNVFTLIVDAFAALADLINKYWPTVKQMFVDLGSFLVQSFEEFDWEKCGRKLLSIPKAIGEFIKTMSGHGDSDWRTAYPGLAAIVDGVKEFGNTSVEKFKEVFNKIKEALGSFLEWGKEKFGDMTPENFAVLAFSAALIYMVIQIGRLAGKSASFIGNIVDFSENLRDGLTKLGDGIASLKGGTFSDKIVKVGLTISILMGLIMAMTQYNTKDILKCVGVIAVLGIVLVAITALFALVGKIGAGNDKKKSVIAIQGIGFAIISMCAGILLMALALKQIQDVGITPDMISTISLFAGIVMVMGALSTYLANQTKSVAKALVSSIAMMVMVSSITKLMGAMVELAKTDPVSITESLKAMMLIMVAFGALMMMGGGFKLTSALGLVIVLGIVKQLLGSMKDIVEQFGSDDMEAFKDSALGIMGVMMAFGLLMGLLSAKGANLGSIGGSMILVAASFVILSTALAIITKTLKDQSIGTLVATGIALIALIGFLLALANVAANMEPEKSGLAFAVVAGGMISIASAMIIMSGALAIISKLADKNVGGLIVATLVFAVMGVMIAALAMASNELKDVKIGPIVAMISGLALILAGLAILYNLNPGRLLVTAMAMTLVIVALSAMMTALGSLKDQTGHLLSLAGMLLVLTGALYLLDDLPDVYHLLAVSGILMLLMATLSVVMQEAGKMGQLAKEGGIAILAIGGAILALSFAVAALTLVAGPGGSELPIMLTTALGLIAFLALMAVVLNIAKGYLSDAKPAAEALALMGAAVLLIGLSVAAISAMASDSENLFGIAGALAVGILAMCAGLRLMDAYSSDIKSAIGSIAALSIAMALVGALMILMEKFKVDYKTVVAVGLGIAAALIAVGYAVKAISKVVEASSKEVKVIQKEAPNFKDLIGPIVSITAAIALIGGLIIAFDRLQIDSNKILGYVLDLSLVIVAFAVCLSLMKIAQGDLKGSLGPLITMTVAVGVIGGLVIALNQLGADINKVGSYVQSLTEALLGMSLCLILISKFGTDASKSLGPLITITVAVGIITGLVIALTALGADVDKVFGYVMSLSNALLMIGITLGLISKFATDADKSLGALITMTAAIGIIGIIMSVLTYMDADWETIAASAVGIGGCLMLMSVAMIAISEKASDIQNSIKALGAMAIAMASVGIVISLMTYISGENWATILAAAVSLGVALMTVGYSLAWIATYASGIQASLGAIGVIAAAMAAASVAIGVISAIAGENWGTVLAASVGIGLTLAVAAFALTLVSNMAGDLSGVAGSIGVVMAAMVAAASALAIIGSFFGTDWAGMGMAAVGIAAVLLAAAGALAIVSGIKKDLSSASSAILTIVGAIALAAVAIGALSQLGNPDGAIQAAIGIAVVVLAMSVALLIASEIGNKALVGAGAMLIMAVALAGVAVAIGGLASYDWDSLLAAAASMAIVILLMAVACLIASGGVAGAAALAILSVAVMGISSALSGLASLDTKSLIVAAATLAVFILVLVGIGMIASGAAIGLTVIVGAVMGLAVALTVIGGAAILFGAAINMIAAGFKVLNKVDMSKVTNGLIELAAAIPEAVGAFGSGLFENHAEIVAAVIEMGTIILEAISELLPQIIEVLTNVVSALLEQIDTFVPQFIQLVTDIIYQLLEQARILAPEFILFVQETVSSLITALGVLIPQINETGIKIVDELLKSIENHLPSIVESGCNIVIEFINGITEKLPEMIQSGTDLIVTWIEGIAEASTQIVEAAFDAVITFIQGLADTMNDPTNQETAKTAMHDLITGLMDMAIAVITGSGEGFFDEGKKIINSLWNGIKEKWESIKAWFKRVLGWDDEDSPLYKLKTTVESFKQAGINIIDGIIEGIEEAWDWLVDKFTKLAETCKEAWESFWDINSPSKVMHKSGIYIIQGAVDGVEEEAPNAVRAMEEVAEDMYDSFENSTRSLADIVNDTLEDGVVIRPVMDLSDVEAGSNQINGMFDDMKLNFDNVNFGGATANLTSRIANRNPGGDIQNGSGNTTNNSNVTFNQYNTSPKALSRYEIYRQTNNQLDMMKGLVTY